MVKLRMKNGEEAELTLGYARLYILKKAKPQIYKAYCKSYIAVGKEEEFDVVFDTIQILYTAYLCGLITEAKPGTRSQELSNAPGFEQFMEMLPQDDIITLLNTMKELVSPKKTKASGIPSGEIQVEVVNV